MRYKIGDIVKVVNLNSALGTSAEKSLGLHGSILEIDDSDEFLQYCVNFKELNDWFWFAEEELELSL